MQDAIDEEVRLTLGDEKKEQYKQGNSRVGIKCHSSRDETSVVLVIVMIACQDTH